MLKIYFLFVVIFCAASAAVPRRLHKCTTKQSGPTPSPPYRTVNVGKYYVKPNVPVVEVMFTPNLPSCYGGVLVVKACDDIRPEVTFIATNSVVIVRKGSLLSTAVVSAKFLCPIRYQEGEKGSVVPYAPAQNPQYQETAHVGSYEDWRYQDQQRPLLSNPDPSYLSNQDC